MAKIYCPKCAWKPQQGDLWWCGQGGCGHAWHTFDTRGQCPKCLKQWKVTACLSCHQWSNHEDWYHDDPGDAERWRRLITETDEIAVKREEVVRA